MSKRKFFFFFLLIVGGLSLRSFYSDGFANSSHYVTPNATPESCKLESAGTSPIQIQIAFRFLLSILRDSADSRSCDQKVFIIVMLFKCVASGRETERKGKRLGITKAITEKMTEQ